MLSDYYVSKGDSGKKRPKQHIIGEKGVAIVKKLLPSHWAVREYAPDYGIDLDVELFCDNYITSGEHILFQVKSTESLGYKTITLFSRMNVEKEYKKVESESCQMDVVQYPIDTDLLVTVEKMGSAVPVLLCVVDVERDDGYFVCLNDYIEKIIIPTKSDYFIQKNVTVNIPVKNSLKSEFGIHVIEWYGKRAKLYSFFNKVNYQYHELEYCNNLQTVQITDHFLKILCRLDVWSAVDYFPALKIVKEEIDYYLEHGNTKEGENILKRMIEMGEDVDSPIYEATYCVGEVSFRESNITQSLHRLWFLLSNVSNIYEDLAKEAYLPTYLASEISY